MTSKIRFVYLNDTKEKVLGVATGYYANSIKHGVYLEEGYYNEEQLVYLLHEVVEKKKKYVDRNGEVSECPVCGKVDCEYLRENQPMCYNISTPGGRPI